MEGKKKIISNIMKNFILWINKNKFTVFLIFFAFITNLSITVFNGIRICIKGECGIYIGNLHYHDFLWHFALAVNAFKTIPFTLPIYMGSILRGYNFLIDIVLFLFTKVGISVLSSYFIILPVAYLILMTLLSYKFFKNRNKDPLFIASGLFFIFFGSSFSYILSLYHFHSWQSFMYAQAMQSGRALLNMSYAWSLPILLGALIILQKDKLTIRKIILLGIFLFFMFGLKFYGGVVLFVLIFVNRFFIWIKKGNVKILFEIVLYLIASYVGYIIFYKTSGSFNGFPFAFSPFAIAHPLIEEKDMFYIPSLVLARYYLVSVNSFSPRLLGIELFTAIIFLIFNFGSRMIGSVLIMKKLIQRKVTRYDGIIILIIIVFTTFTLLFVQKGEWWNIIQFLGYTLFLMNFFAAEALFYLLKSKKKIFLLIGIGFILLTLPTNIEQVSFAGERHISFNNEELNALTFLKKNQMGLC